MDELLPTLLNILIVDDEVNIRKTLALCLNSDGHRVVAVSNVSDAIAESGRAAFDMAFVDLRLGAEQGMELFPQLLEQCPWMKIVIITAHGTIDSAVEAMKRGASDYLTKPFTPDQVRLVTQRVAQVRALEQRVARLHGMVGKEDTELNLQTSNAAMRRALELAHEVARSETTILLRGESGTGKGIFARAIHRWSPRANRPMATVSCPSLSAQLLESELFGHVKGAFTGAIRDNPGRLAATDGGTLFLDEIGDLPLELQPKLLRFLQEREYERVGDAVTRRADVRIITATNVDLAGAVKAGKFREDLYYRINVVQIDLPALRERKEDIPYLAELFLAEFRKEKRITGFTPEAMGAMVGYDWPGNVRELRNAIERAVILCRGDQIGMEQLSGNLRTAQDRVQELGDMVSLNKLEEQHIRRVLARAASLEEAASILGIDVATLWRRRKKYQI